ncbi:uncharacterized protein LOC124156596 [Ischnura elegans]|uniref:uncharacterized protein LOC124156596 n=1 Tax=Ischnura elegans TaxID=197161 RepID=UPI001ED8894B|nr:uncharacterized protein LOC124156596 [Ischnura elegans]
MGRKHLDYRANIQVDEELCGKIKSALHVSPNFSLCVLETLRALETLDKSCESRHHGWPTKTLVSILKSANCGSYAYGDVEAQMRAALRRERKACTVTRTCVGWRLSVRGKRLVMIRGRGAVWKKEWSERDRERRKRVVARKVDCGLCGNCGRILSGHGGGPERQCSPRPPGGQTGDENEAKRKNSKGDIKTTRMRLLGSWRGTK